MQGTAVRAAQPAVTARAQSHDQTATSAATDALAGLVRFCEINEPIGLARASGEHEVVALRRAVGMVERWLRHFAEHLPTDRMTSVPCEVAGDVSKEHVSKGRGESRGGSDAIAFEGQLSGFPTTKQSRNSKVARQPDDAGICGSILSRTKRIERLRRRAARVPWREHQQPPFNFAPNEHKTIFRAALGLPSFAREAVYSRRHCAGEVRAVLQALAVEDMPVQVPQDHVARRRRFVEGGEGVSAHARRLSRR
jgi:hypothetical protein